MSGLIVCWVLAIFYAIQAFTGGDAFGSWGDLISLAIWIFAALIATTDKLRERRSRPSPVDYHRDWPITERIDPPVP